MSKPIWNVKNVKLQLLHYKSSSRRTKSNTNSTNNVFFEEVEKNSSFILNAKWRKKI